MSQFALSDAARVKLNSELARHESCQRFTAATAFVVAPLGAAKRTHPITFVALVGELRLAHQQLPPGERLQLRPVAAIGKLRSPRQYPRPSKAAKFIPAGKPLRHLRLGNDQPFQNPRIILRRQIIFTLVSNASSQ